MQRVLDWFSDLSVAQRAPVVLLGAVALFAASFFVTLVILSLRSGADGSDPSAQATAPGVTYPEESAPTDPFAGAENIDLKISRARWSGGRVEVEGFTQPFVEADTEIQNVPEPSTAAD